MAQVTYSKQYSDAIQAIKQAILQSRYTAARLINREMLALYYAVGEYISSNSRTNTWGTGALEFISQQLQQELPHRFPTLDHQQVLDDVKIGGYHVLAGKGSTEFGIASATTELIRAVFHDEKKVLPCSCYLDGQYGEAGIFASTPAVIGKDGIEDIFELQITEEELTLFKASCAIIREHATKAEAM